MTKIISLVNHKGGVGKTSSTLNIGKALNLQGKKVLLIDIDPQANLTLWSGIESSKKSIYHTLCEKEILPIHTISKDFDIVPSSLVLSKAEVMLQADLKGYFKLKKALKELKQTYDYILIDCPPSLGILTLNALVASNEVIVVVQAQYLAVDGLNTILEVITELSEDLETTWKIAGILLTQVKNTNISKACVEVVRENYGNITFHNVIRENTALVEASSKKKNIFDYSPQSTSAKDYLEISKEILKNG